MSKDNIRILNLNEQNTEIPDTIPGCYGEYSGCNFGCNTCIFESPCSKITTWEGA